MKYLIILLITLYFWDGIKYYIKVKFGLICEHVFSIEEGKAVCEKCKYIISLPPVHYNCRCIYAPILKEE